MENLKDKPNVNAPDGNFQFGSMRDDTGTDDGSRADTRFMSDYTQFFERMFEEYRSVYGVAANGLLDNDTNGYQLWDAFRKLSRPYKVYVALVTQVGAAAPVATVLQNEIGVVTWSRSAQGFYIATTLALFTSNKTTVDIPNDAFAGQYSHMGSAPANTSQVWVLSRDVAGAGQDGLMDKTTVEIRVYD